LLSPAREFRAGLEYFDASPRETLAAKAGVARGGSGKIAESGAALAPQSGRF